MTTQTNRIIKWLTCGTGSADIATRGEQFCITVSCPKKYMSTVVGSGGSMVKGLTVLLGLLSGGKRVKLTIAEPDPADDDKEEDDGGTSGDCGLDAWADQGVEITISPVSGVHWVEIAAPQEWLVDNFVHLRKLVVAGLMIRGVKQVEVSEIVS